MSFNNYVIIWIIIGFLTFTYLIISKVRAPYGRHSSDGWGLMMALGYIVLESLGEI